MELGSRGFFKRLEAQGALPVRDVQMAGARLVGAMSATLTRLRWLR